MRGRLAVLMAAVTLLAVASAVVVLVAVSRVRDANRELVTELIPAQADATELGVLYRDLAVNIATDVASPQVVQSAWQTTRQLRDQIRPLVQTDEPMRTDFATLERRADAWIAVATPSSEQVDLAGSADEFTELRDALATLSDDLHAAVRGRQSEASNATDAVRAAAAASALVLLAAGAAVIVLSRRWVSDPIDDLTAQVAEVAGGHLTRPIHPSGPDDLASVGASVESMRRRLLDDARQRVDSALIAGHQAESARIAGQIHDDQVQAMTFASIRLQQLRRRVSDDPDLVSIAEAAEHATNEAITRLRRMIFELHSPVLESDGLLAAIETYLDETFDESVTWSVRGDAGDVSPGTAGLAYRLAREAMFNTFKHASAHSIEVTVDHTPTALSVEVRDDGVGFEVGAATSEVGHLGVDHSRQLAAAAGGSWTCSSGPGRGTTVSFVLPVDVNDRGPAES